MQVWVLLFRYPMPDKQLHVVKYVNVSPKNVEICIHVYIHAAFYIARPFDRM